MMELTPLTDNFVSKCFQFFKMNTINIQVLNLIININIEKRVTFKRLWVSRIFTYKNKFK